MSGNNSVCMHGRAMGIECPECCVFAAGLGFTDYSKQRAEPFFQYVREITDIAQLLAAPITRVVENSHLAIDAKATCPPLKPWQIELQTLRNNSARYQYLREMATRPEILQLLELNPDQWDAFIDLKLIQEGVRHK